MKKFKRYTYTRPELLPTDWDADRYLTDAEFKAAGFDPKDEETGTGTLASDWNGHKAGAAVISEMTCEGHSFAVEIAETGAEK